MSLCDLGVRDLHSVVEVADLLNAFALTPFLDHFADFVVPNCPFVLFLLFESDQVIHFVRDILVVRTQRLELLAQSLDFLPHVCRRVVETSPRCWLGLQGFLGLHSLATTTSIHGLHGGLDRAGFRVVGAGGRWVKEMRL